MFFPIQENAVISSFTVSNKPLIFTSVFRDSFFLQLKLRVSELIFFPFKNPNFHYFFRNFHERFKIYKMIVRTYGRKKSGLTRSYSDSDFSEDVCYDDSLSFRESLSQETSYSVGFSSQDSTTWNFVSEIYGSQHSLSLLPPRIPDSLSQGDMRKSKKPRKNLKRELKQIGDVKPSNSKGAGIRSNSTLTTSTLMEAQESGEMMEHVDEVSYALDGLRKGQQSRIRRASLLALLSICATASQRRLLRTQGMAKTIIDSILALSFDDSPSNLGAAAIFYILASDGQDDQLLDSPVCIRFLLNLLRPSIRVKVKDKLPSIGGKLLALHRNTVTLEDRTKALEASSSAIISKVLDASSTAIISKVQDILLSSQEIESSDRDDGGVGRPELTLKWIALLTMEKACLSTVSLEDTYGTFGRAGGSFKERLRELGGLDAVFDVARNCHFIMEGWSRKTMPSVKELKDEGALETVMLLLKCLKIMENATFLSKDNQVHLLGMKGKSDFGGSSRSFTNLMISLIRILSGLSLPHGHASKIMSMEDKHFDLDGIVPSSSSGRCCGTDKASQDSIKVSQKFQRLSTSPSVIYVSRSETTSSSYNNRTSRSSHCGVGRKINGLKMNAGLSKRTTVTKTSECINLDDSEDSFAFNERSKLTNGGVGLKVNDLKISAALSTRSSVAKDSECINLDDSEDPFAFNETSSSSNDGVGIKINGLKMSLSKRPSVTENAECINLDDSQDPFAFDEEEFKPSKWDTLSKNKVTRTQKSRKSVREFDDLCVPMLITSQSETSREENYHSCEITESPAVEDGNPNLLSDCLLTAVKVLMNLTNDNPLGCQQIAACEGLETLSKLILGHFPSFTKCIYLCKHTKDSNTLQCQKDRHLTDQELDFLVAILGLLVNLVEKDSQNRSRLAATSVSLATSGESEETESHADVIPLLCSIFLANQGAGEAAEDGNQLTWSEEAAVQQGEHEAEKMIIEAYAALLLAFLSTESTNVCEAISSCLPDHSLEILVPVLERFVAFHLTLNMISPGTHAAVSEVIESCRRS